MAKRKTASRARPRRLKACHSPEIFITDDTVIKWATKHGVLEGANLHEVLQ